MTFLRIFLRALGVTSLLFLGGAVPWLLLAGLLPLEVDTPSPPQLLGVWIFVFGMALTVETLTGGFDERGDK